MNFFEITESILKKDMKCFEVYGLNINEMAYKHTLWITDKGKVLDISSTRLTHHTWADSHRNKFKYNDNNLSPFEMTARSGWIKVRNHVNLDIEGSNESIHKNRKTIMEIIDDRIFTAGKGSFSMMIQELDNEGSVNKRIIFSLPQDDAKLRRYL